MKTTQITQVAALEKLLSRCNAHGPMYNPSKASIKVAAIGTLLTQAREKEEAANVSRTAFQNAVNARRQAYDALPELIQRITGVLQASSVNAAFMDDFNAIKRRFYVRRKVKASEAEASTLPQADTPTQVSTAQLDFESKASHFSKLVTMIATQPLYAPNEADLKVTALKAVVDSLHAKNKAVVDAETALKNAQVARRQILNGPNGVYETGMASKAYIKSLFGNRSEAFEQISKIKFTKKK